LCALQSDASIKYLFMQKFLSDITPAHGLIGQLDLEQVHFAFNLLYLNTLIVVIVGWFYYGSKAGSVHTLRSRFGVVMQDPFLFSGSIRENIAFNDPTLSLEAVARAAKLAAIDDEIIQMPMGYETMVSEGGARLSGGQIQRIALARALAHNPVILILDDATSHLDAVTERLVDHNLSQLSCTRIVITHRLSTVRNADVICVLKEGRIVERGTHAELLALKGCYAELVHSQLEDDTDDLPVKATLRESFGLRF
jgi:ABC-type methionine transport system ATPase subunit